MNWHQEQSYRWAEIHPDSWDQVRFEKLSSYETNIDFINHLSKKSMGENHVLLNGSGVASADIDGDGDLDILVTGFDGGNALYINNGEGKFSLKENSELTHMLFINEGKTFSAQPLPAKAQWSNAFYAGVADYDSDGNEDLFLSQNFFAVPPKKARLDAGRGLWLRGNGEGHFTPVSGNETGIKIYGEQRGAALGDFNRDGKVDLAVSQNGARTKLYLNNTENRGDRSTSKVRHKIRMVLDPLLGSYMRTEKKVPYGNCRRGADTCPKTAWYRFLV